MKNKLNLTILPFLVFIVLLGFLLKGLFSDPRERDSALIGQPMPEFQLPDLMSPSKLYDVKTLLSQGPVVLNVWGTWCTTCQYELPFLTKLKTEYGVRIIGIYYDQNHAPEFGQYADLPTIRTDVNEMLARLGNPYQFNILDLDRGLSLNLGVTGAPESFIVGSNGKIHAHHMGDINERVWREELAPIWNEVK